MLKNMKNIFCRPYYAYSESRPSHINRLTNQLQQATMRNDQNAASYAKADLEYLHYSSGIDKNLFRLVGATAMAISIFTTPLPAKAIEVPVAAVFLLLARDERRMQKKVEQVLKAAHVAKP